MLTRNSKPEFSQTCSRRALLKSFGSGTSSIWNGEILRLRRLKANFMAATVHKGLATLLEPLHDDEVGVHASQLARQLATDWARRKPSAVKKVERLLASANLSMEAALAHTFLKHFESLEQIEHMIATMEKRRDAVVREIEHRRATLAQAVRRTVEQIERNDYQVLGDRSTLRDRPQ